MGRIVMKATELMIGDWILYGDKPVKVLQLSENGKYGWVKPIPLTYEILKKNGFKEAALREPNTTNLVRKWWSKHGEIYIKEYYLARSREIVYVVGGGSRMRIENIYMVHQLQHALRICELDELADNFKI